MKLISGSSNRQFAEAISDYLDKPLADAEFTSFSDEETVVNINENMRGEDVFVIQSTSQPANHHYMELMIGIDALRRSSARRITAVIPYFGYARQDSKSGSRTPITARLLADLLTTAGANRVLTMDLHSRQTQGFFNIPCDNLFAQPIFQRDIKERFEYATEPTVIVSPDVGGTARARAIANKLHVELAIVDKRRPGANQSEVMNVVGNVKDKNCIIIDDMVDTGGTLCNAAKALKNEGAAAVHAYATHGVLSGPAIERLESTDELSDLTVTDTILNEQARTCEKVRYVPATLLFARAIRRIHEEQSVSALFD